MGTQGHTRPRSSPYPDPKLNLNLSLSPKPTQNPITIPILCDSVGPVRFAVTAVVYVYDV